MDVVRRLKTTYGIDNQQELSSIIYTVALEFSNHLAIDLGVCAADSLDNLQSYTLNRDVHVKFDDNAKGNQAG